MNYFSLDNKSMTCSIFREQEHKKEHEVYNLPPCEWAANYGATHTLYIGKKKDINGSGTRPAKLLKTVLYVGVDELEGGGIKWEKWLGVIKVEWVNCGPVSAM